MSLLRDPLFIGDARLSSVFEPAPNLEELPWLCVLFGVVTSLLRSRSIAVIYPVSSLLLHTSARQQPLQVAFMDKLNESDPENGSAQEGAAVGRYCPEHAHPQGCCLTIVDQVTAEFKLR